MCYCIQLWKEWLSFNLLRDWGPSTDPLVVMGTRPGWMQGLIFIFLVWRVRSTVPLIRMLTWPAILWRNRQNIQSDKICRKIYKHLQHPTIIFFIPTTATPTLTYDPGALVGVCVRVLPHDGWRWWRRVCRLDLQWVLLQVLLDDLQVHLGAGGGSHSAPGPSSAT